MNNKVNFVKLYIFTIATFALFCVIFSLRNLEINLSFVYGFLAFSSLAVISNMSPIELPRVGTVTITFAIHLASIAIFGPIIAIVSEIISAILLYFKRDKKERFKEIFNGSQFIICIYLSSLVSKPWLDDLININILQIKSFFLISLIYFSINTILVTLVISLDQKLKPWNVWVTNFRLLTPHYLTLAPLGLLVAVIYYYLGPLGLALFFIPLFLARHSFKLYMEMRFNYLNTIETLIKSIEAKDTYTCGHSERVAKYSIAIGKELGLNDIELEQLNYLALLHDIGKVAISDTIINKVGKLDDNEFDIVKNHPQVGAEIVRNIKLLQDDQGVILHHHERWDGLGYPHRVKGNEIPLPARIISVADSFDAMTSDRAYRKALAYETAVDEIIKNSGMQFDPQVVTAFLRVIPTIIPEINLERINLDAKFNKSTNLAY